MKKVDERAQEKLNVPKDIQSKDIVKKPNKFRALIATKKRKVLVGLASLFIVVGVLLVVPVSRYGILGQIIKKSVELSIVDSETKKPVSGATVQIGKHRIVTDAKGKVTFSAVAVGQYELQVEKKYYETTKVSYTVPVLSQPRDISPRLKATGREVVVTVTNKIDNVAVADASISINGSSVLTDKSGVATIVLPVKKDKQTGEIKKDGYITKSVDVVVSDKDQAISVQMTPQGQVFFLSKRTGTINVMKSNLDGTSQGILLAGTGKERDSETYMFASPNWRYLSLFAMRDSDKAKLYLVNTNDGHLTTIDEGDASFTAIGWSNDTFVYMVRRNINPWEGKVNALKSYNATTSVHKTIDETSGEGDAWWNSASEEYSNTNIIGGDLVFSKSWSGGSYDDMSGKKTLLIKVGVDGANRKVVKEFNQVSGSYLFSRVYSPTTRYFAYYSQDSKKEYYSYSNGSMNLMKDMTEATYEATPNELYLISPDGTKSLWHELRDGKYVIFVGDRDGKNGQSLGVSDYMSYSWYTDRYILLSKNSNELYIMSVNGAVDTTTQPQKISDMHSPVPAYLRYALY